MTQPPPQRRPNCEARTTAPSAGGTNRIRSTPETPFDEPYFVEVDNNGCEKCGAGKTWTVVGPDGVAQGQSFENVEDAEALADALNGAFFAGRTEPSLKR